MKKIKFLMYSPLLLLVVLAPYFVPEQEAQPVAAAPYKAQTSVGPPDRAALAANHVATQPVAAPPVKAQNGVSRQQIVTYALSLLGKPYTFGGTTSSGFDCSGFTNHVFNTFGIKVSRSSGTQAVDGRPVSKEEAKPGDLVIFTGTNPDVRNPGHVGIVISQPGDTISFVHSSSNGGVKVSKVEGTRYNTRFLQIRRVL